MKLNWSSSLAAIAITTVFFLAFQKGGQKDAWTEKQLMAPGDLASKLKSGNTANTVVFDMGPSGQIKNAIEIGPAQDNNNLSRLKKKLAQLPKTTEVVVYCGCCPFNHCPNVRPAFALLNEMKFTNAKLLNLPKNLKADWIDKGYPMQQ